MVYHLLSTDIATGLIRFKNTKYTSMTITENITRKKKKLLKCCIRPELHLI